MHLGDDEGLQIALKNQQFSSFFEFASLFFLGCSILGLLLRNPRPTKSIHQEGGKGVLDNIRR